MGSEGTRVTGREALTLTLVLLAAAVLRMGWPGLTEFKADEARLLSLALEMSQGRFALRGISSSVGLPNFPMSVWLYALPLLIRPHPYAATLFTGLLSTLAVAGTYWLARRYWGVTAALAAAVMYALSPWAIVFSRKIWAQNLLPVVVIGWAICAALAFVDGRRPFVALHLLLLAVAVQIHPAAVGLVPATLVFLVVFRRNVAWRWVAVGIVLALITAAPFLWYLGGLWRSGEAITLGAGRVVGGLSAESLRLAATIAVGRGVEALAGEEFARRALNLPLLTLAYSVWIALIGLGILWVGVQVLRNWSSAAVRVGFTWLAWLFAPVLVFLWAWTPIYIHYFIAVLPAPFLLAGVLFQRLLADVRPVLRAATWIALLAVAGVLLHAWAATMVYVAAQPGATAFGVPLATKLAAADTARALRQESGAAEVLIAGTGSAPDVDDFPAEFDALLWDVPRRFVNLNREAVFSGEASVVLLGPRAEDAVSSTRVFYLSAAERLTHIGGGDEPETYTVGKLAPDVAPAPQVAVPEVLLANWVRLTGYGLRQIDDTGPLWDVYWWPGDNPDPADYHFFNHLLDATGARVAQSDAAAFTATQWRPGDRVISRFHLPLEIAPAAPLSMRVGMYRFPSLEAVPVLDEAANPAGDAVEWSLADPLPSPSD